MALVIPFFISHRGCPHRCLFCNQGVISGQSPVVSSPDETDLERTIELWTARTSGHAEVQVAFYGGSFTCLEEKTQSQLLRTVSGYIDKGIVDSVRLSTRPDCISDDICRFLLDNRVSTVELGVQSMSDKVLSAALRGHTAEESRRAIELLKTYGVKLGVQLMPGLPGETTASFLDGVDKIIGLRPDFVRLYPAIVIKETGLARLYKTGSWMPLSMNRAITLTRKARDRFGSRNIRVIRMGLQPSEDLEKNILAGPYHPAFGELVVGRSWYLRARKALHASSSWDRAVFRINGKDLSAFLGKGRRNLARLQELFPGRSLAVKQDNSLDRDQLEYVIS